MLKLGLKSLRLLLLFLTVSLIVNSTFANQNFTVKYLSTENGLSNNYVTCVCQDYLGFIWFGTRDGLNRWDGYSFKTFRNQPSDSTSLPDNFIRCLTADNEGNIWVGTNQAGVSRFNIHTEEFYTFPTDYEDKNAFPDIYARIIFKQNDTTFWFGTNSGLVLYNAKNNNFIRTYLTDDNKRKHTREQILSIFKINNDSIAVQSNIGLFVISKQIVKPLLLPSKLGHPKTLLENNPVFYASNGDVWFADPDVLYHYESKDNKLNGYTSNINKANSISSTDVSGIYEDSSNDIWIITWDGGANLFNSSSKSFTRFSQGDAQELKFSDNIVTNIFEDSYKNLWFTTEEGGINYLSLRKNKMPFYSHSAFNKNSLINNKVGTFYPSDNGNILIGTGDGTLSNFNPKQQVFTNYTVSQNLASSVLGIAKIDKDHYYITGWGLGLYKYNFKSGESENILKGIPNLNYNKTIHENIRSFTVDKSGYVWLAIHSFDGLAVYNPDENVLYDSDHPGPINTKLISVPFPGSILIDSTGRIWVTSYSGLYMFDGNDFFEFKANDNTDLQISSNYVYSVYEDTDGTIWVGTSAGLDKIKITAGEISIEQLNSTKDNIPGNIKSIIGDNNKRLWLSSSQGIIRYNTINKHARHFQVNQNVGVLEFSERACAYSKIGDIYFGTTQGFLQFNPDSLDVLNESSQIYFTDFRLFNKSQKTGKSGSVLHKSIISTDTIHLKHNENVIGIEFTPLEINLEEKYEYEYMLKGIDKTWVEAGKNRLITYAHLPYGEYDFIVRFASTLYNANPSSAKLHLIISPPFWRTKLAYASYVIFIILALFIFRRSVQYREKLKSDLKLQRIKIQNVEETNLMKLRFFTNISHEFRTPLTLIKVPLEKLLNKNHPQSDEERKYHYELMLNSATKLDKMVTQLMDYRKMEAGSLVLEPRYGDFIEFCKKVVDNFNSLAIQKSISYTFYSPIDSKWMAFDSDKLEKVLSNLLSNAFKNTPKLGKIQISVIPQGNSDDTNSTISLIVEDSGRGIDAEDLPHIFDRFYMVSSKEATQIQGTGIGLALAKELIEMHQGTIKAESVKEEGAKFTFVLPCNIAVKKTVEEDNEVPTEAADTKAVTPEQENSTTKLTKQKLLLVDDDEDMLEFLTRELNPQYELTTAKNGQEAFELAQEHKPDIIVSDVMMPLVTGIELCNKIKSNELTSHIPIILLTARYSSEKKIEGLESGANAYIMKPFNLDELLLTISNFLDSRKNFIEKFKTDSNLSYENNDLESTDQKLVQKVIDVVLNNITDNKINADVIAKQVFVSRTVLYIKIEALTGQTVNEFINSVRLKKSKQLLVQGELNISEVSFAVGFTSQSYFSRTFTKQYGYAPREFIKQNQQD